MQIQLLPQILPSNRNSRFVQGASLRTSLFFLRALKVDDRHRCVGGHGAVLIRSVTRKEGPSIPLRCEQWHVSDSSLFGRFHVEQRAVSSAAFACQGPEKPNELQLKHQTPFDRDTFVRSFKRWHCRALRFRSKPHASSRAPLPKVNLRLVDQFNCRV